MHLKINIKYLSNIMENKTLTDLRKVAQKKKLPGYSTLDRTELIKYIKTGKKPQTNSFNLFFDKIYVINLHDKVDRWRKVSSAFRRRGIKVDRFVAIDGRCKGKQCEIKRKQFEKEYKVKIPKSDLNLPASSLLLGTILILREMVRKKWKHVLICEDDIVLGRDVKQRFAQGIRELKRVQPNWDLLYLGCGHNCGWGDISYERTGRIRYKSEVAKIYEAFEPDMESWYVARKDDLRLPCEDKETCPTISKHLSRAFKPKGTWCYAYSLKGAKKFLKIVNDRIDDHVDQIIAEAVAEKDLIAVAFDPPIVWHYLGALRPESDIPWDW